MVLSLRSEYQMYFMKNLVKNQKRKPLVWDKWQTLLSSSRSSAFLRHAVRIDDEHERYQLLEKEPRIPLNPHQPPAGDMHEDIPEITTCSFLREQIGPDEESQHESDFQPLVDGSDTTKIVEAVAEPKRDANERKAVKPERWIASSATEGEDEPEQHCRGTARFYRSCNPVPPHNEDDDPWGQTEKVYHPRGNPPLARACVLTTVASVLREPQKDLVEEVADTSPHLQKDIHSNLPVFV